MCVIGAIAAELLQSCDCVLTYEAESAHAQSYTCSLLGPVTYLGVVQLRGAAYRVSIAYPVTVPSARRMHAEEQLCALKVQVGAVSTNGGAGALWPVGRQPRCQRCVY